MLQPVAEEIGRIVIEWNALRDAFGLLCTTMIDPGPSDEPVDLHDWHRMRDEHQLGMVREFSKAHAELLQERSAPTFSEDMAHLLNLAEKLADCRNSVVQTPIVLALDPQASPAAVVADVFFDHPPAQRRSRDELAAEFRRWRQAIETVKATVEQMRATIAFGPAKHPWPQRPALSL
jgi:hypothetical protein